MNYVLVMGFPAREASAFSGPAIPAPFFVTHTSAQGIPSQAVPDTFSAMIHTFEKLEDASDLAEEAYDMGGASHCWVFELPTGKLAFEWPETPK